MTTIYTHAPIIFAPDTIMNAACANQEIHEKMDDIDLLKADKSYVDSILVSGSPKGVYATLAALTAAIPAGNTNIYLVTADGKWYYWNGAAWTAGGTYQSTGIADGSITPVMLNSEIPNTKNTNNLFIKSTATLGKYISDTTGLEVVNAAFGYVTLNVVPGAYYFVNYNYGANGHRGVYFDSGGSNISAIDGTTYYFVNKTDGTRLAFVVAATAATVKINFLVADIDNVIIFQDASKVHDGVTIEDKWLDSNVVKRRDIPFVSNILDDINSVTIIDYAYTSVSHPFISSTTFGQNAPIPVTAGEIYLVENFTSTYAPSTLSTRGIFLDANFIYVSLLVADDSTSYSPKYTVPAGAAYMMVLFETALLSTFSIKRIYSPTVNDMMIRRNAIYPGYWISKKWVSFGDSITYRELWQPDVVTELGLVHTNCGIGSTQLAGTGATAFWQDARLDVVKAADPDVITILGGANDLVGEILIGTAAEFAAALGAKDTNLFLGAYSYIIENLLTWKPTLKIILLTTTYAHLDGATMAPASGLRYTDYANATKLVALYYGLLYVDLHGEAEVNKLTQSTYTSDGIHPNTDGAKAIAKLVIAGLEKISPF